MAVLMIILTTHRKMANHNKFVDISGRKFGSLTVSGLSHRNKHGKIVWSCICDCGNSKSIITQSLLSGHTRSCGCYNKSQTSAANGKDLTGRRFGRLVVQKFCGISLHGKYKWLCMCDCGNSKSVLSASLIGGRTASCGWSVLTIRASNNRPSEIEIESAMKYLGSNRGAWRIITLDGWGR